MSQTSIKNSVVRPESIGWNVRTQKVSDSGNGQNGTKANVGAIEPWFFVSESAIFWLQCWAQPTKHGKAGAIQDSMGARGGVENRSAREPDASSR